MSSEFVRFAPEIETIDPKIDELLAQIIDFWEKKGRESPRTEGAGRAVRGAHAKSFGLAKAPGRPGESHPRAPTERNVTVSRHSALLIHPSEVGHPCPVDEEIRLSSLKLTPPPPGSLE